MSVPRMGAPAKIQVTPTEVFLFYSVPFQRLDFRVVPIGKRPREPDRDGTWMGSPVARFEGDTLIIETIGFNAESWFGPQGYIHGYDMKVTERFQPQGETLVWQATVEDPEYLVKPWVMDPAVLARSTGPAAYLAETPPCSERDNKNLVGKQREM
jgi:hypothetical protein